MSADGGHLGWRFGSLEIILKVDHLRTIHAMFALNWLTGLYYTTLKKDVLAVIVITNSYLNLVEKIELVSSFIYSQPYANMESRLYNTLYKRNGKYPPSFRWIFNHLLRMQKYCNRYQKRLQVRLFLIMLFIE